MSKFTFVLGFFLEGALMLGTVGVPYKRIPEPLFWITQQPGLYIAQWFVHFFFPHAGFEGEAGYAHFLAFVCQGSIYGVVFSLLFANFRKSAPATTTTPPSAGDRSSPL